MNIETSSRVSRSSIPRLSMQFGRTSQVSTSKLGSTPKGDNFLKPGNIMETDLLDESNMNLGHESEGFGVYSDLKFLYQIGKICAESGKFLEEGILCLDDYINLLNFFNPTQDQQTPKVRRHASYIGEKTTMQSSVFSRPNILPNQGL